MTDDRMTPSEAAARRRCIAAGHDPDEMVTPVYSMGEEGANRLN